MNQTTCVIPYMDKQLGSHHQSVSANNLWKDWDFSQATVDETRRREKASIYYKQQKQGNQAPEDNSGRMLAVSVDPDTEIRKDEGKTDEEAKEPVFMIIADCILDDLKNPFTGEFI